MINLTNTVVDTIYIAFWDGSFNKLELWSNGEAWLTDEQEDCTLKVGIKLYNAYKENRNDTKRAKKITDMEYDACLYGNLQIF